MPTTDRRARDNFLDYLDLPLWRQRCLDRAWFGSLTSISRQRSRYHHANRRSRRGVRVYRQVAAIFGGMSDDDNDRVS